MIDYSTLEMIKLYFKLRTAKSLSYYEELENDEKLSKLFRDSLNYFIDNMAINYSKLSPIV
ncbi:hypothetical protein A1E_01140 [Rickettsia canadensis str. McKiel]|uniref:Uncharacterized protein n=1 Tax=Rickettsia canadensis (strain McKiel) TaxID=293613 RepID=A8EXU0_RICCK|nr:hypothetical protein [Rickettsia canadensis]ABV73173.1 hypothetical protein A1E_01140 [Rickettsia canadensis str. McKiel]